MPKRHFGMKKQLLYTAIILAVFFLLAELAARTLLSVQLGSRIFLYGTPAYRSDEQSVVVRYGTEYSSFEGYEKYFPRQSVVGTDCINDGTFDIEINSSGFRGEDLPLSKPSGVKRIVMLGASSTFGFCDRDDDTYPQQLERMLEGSPDKFEVINLGIPHLTSGQITSLFFNEALAYDPDIVTFYEGHNDTHALKDEPRELTSKLPVLRDALDLAGRYSVIFLRVSSLLDEAPKGFTAEFLYGPAETASLQLLKNIEQIYAECERRGIAFIVATQQMQSLMLDREELAGVSYSEEVERVEGKLAREGELTHREFGFLAHDIFMKDLVAWAETNSVPLVDVIGALDDRRDTLMSPVHINAEGNEIVARAFFDKVVELTAR